MAGEALLGAAVGVLLDRLTSKELINFFQCRKHNERLLKKLKLKLLGLNKVLNDAEDKQITDRAVKEWLDELKDAIYHAEDLVDEIATEALRCKVKAEYQSGSNQKLKALPGQMNTLLPSLEMFLLACCPEIESFPKGGLPSKLRTLYIVNCKKLVGGWRDWGLQRLPSLTRFAVGGESEDVLESFPEEGLLPSTVTTFWIICMPNLKSLNDRGLQLLGSLKYMDIWDCPHLQSLPEEGLPSSLFELQIRECPLLKPRCHMEGEDWHKIAHIPLINIDGEAIFDQVYLGPVDPTMVTKFYDF